jgi:hypothetical protein
VRDLIRKILNESDWGWAEEDISIREVNLYFDSRDDRYTEEYFKRLFKKLKDLGVKWNSGDEIRPNWDYISDIIEPIEFPSHYHILTIDSGDGLLHGNVRNLDDVESEFSPPYYRYELLNGFEIFE